MKYDFNKIIDRRNSDSIKWNLFDHDVLPLWVADMDMPAPDGIIHALQERVHHGVFGYAIESTVLKETIAERMFSQYEWQVSPEAVILLPGVITGFNLACHTAIEPSTAALIQTPVYPPFLSAPSYAGLVRQEMELTLTGDGSYEIDLDAFRSAITNETRLFILCNPHNPVGRVFHRNELEAMALLCLQNQVLICSDEIHSDLVFPGHQHIPIASLNPEVEASTITLIAPSKTYNIAGLDCAAAIIPNPKLRNSFNHVRRGLVHGPNLLGQTAALAAYRTGDEWLKQILIYLEGNRDYLYSFIQKEMPGISMPLPEGTYLAWMDCRKVIPGNPQEFFLNHAKVGLNDGADFGTGGYGFVRLNFGCPRPILSQALNQMKDAYERKEYFTP